MEPSRPPNFTTMLNSPMPSAEAENPNNQYYHFQASQFAMNHLASSQYPSNMHPHHPSIHPFPHPGIQHPYNQGSMSYGGAHPSLIPRPPTHLPHGGAQAGLSSSPVESNPFFGAYGVGGSRGEDSCSPMSGEKRSAAQCKGHWTKTTPSVTLFHSCYIRTKNVYASGQSEEGLMEKVRAMYINQAKVKRPFALEYWWRVVKEEPKWRNQYMEEDSAIPPRYRTTSAKSGMMSFISSPSLGQAPRLLPDIGQPRLVPGHVPGLLPGHVPHVLPGRLLSQICSSQAPSPAPP